MGTDRLVGSRSVVEQIRATRGGPLDSLGVPPGRDGPVVARQQHLGHIEAAPGRRLGIDGVFEQPVLVGLLDERLGVADDPGNSRATASTMASTATSPPLST